MSFTEIEKSESNAWSNRIIGAAIDAHRFLGPGLLESAYHSCLVHELSLLGIPFQSQVAMNLDYKGLLVQNAYRLDLFVAGKVIVELKAAERLEPVFDAQLMTYLRLSKCWLGLLINFNVKILKEGIKRIVLG